MTIQMTIIGLGEVGTSAGLALQYSKKDIFRVGADLHKYAEENALKSGAVDKIIHNQFDAIRNADIILLALPLPSIQETLKLLGKEIKPGTVVLETGTGKVAANQYAMQFLQDPSHFVGLYPAINPAYLGERSAEHHSAHEDFFKGGTLFVVNHATSAPDALKLGADLGALWGAHTAFIEAEEMDGLIGATATLPRVLSAALMTQLTAQPGWMEMRKAGCKSLAQMTDSLSQPYEKEQFADSLLENRENMLRFLNQFALHLRDYRDALESRDRTKLLTFYADAQRKRETWLKEYSEGTWRHEEENKMKAPTMGDVVGQWFFGGLSRRKKDG